VRAFLYRRKWNTQCVGYLCLAITTEVLQCHYYALTRRKLFEGRANVTCRISPLDVGLGAERIIGNHFGLSQRSPCWPEVSAGDAIAVLGDDSSEPGNERSRVPQVNQMEVDVQKGLLGGLARELDIAQPTHREGHGEALKPYDKHRKRSVVTALRRGDDLSKVARTGYARRAAHIKLDPF